MGYFSNGSEGMDYEHRYCSRCINQNDDGGCPVMDLHWLWNYEACDDKTKDLALQHFIPRERLGNAQCRMFKERGR